MAPSIPRNFIYPGTPQHKTILAGEPILAKERREKNTSRRIPGDVGLVPTDNIQTSDLSPIARFHARYGTSWEPKPYKQTPPTQDPTEATAELYRKMGQLMHSLS
jgi:hypothetical protein